MQITEVRIKLVEERQENERLYGFCSITLDQAFVVRDLKIIEGARGWFVAMPSRKLMDRCAKCGYKNQLKAHFCNQCGGKLYDNRAGRDNSGRTKLHADIAHPIHASCRELIQNAVMKEFFLEKEKAKLPGYVCTYDDMDPEGEPVSYTETAAEINRGYNTEESAPAKPT